jgi:hypothetical protein
MKRWEARYVGHHRIERAFSDGGRGGFDVDAYLTTRHGPLLEPRYDERYLQRFFIEAGALCWPHGLELSPARLQEISRLEIAA